MQQKFNHTDATKIQPHDYWCDKNNATFFKEQWQLNSIMWFIGQYNLVIEFYWEPEVQNLNNCS